MMYLIKNIQIFTRNSFRIVMQWSEWCELSHRELLFSVNCSVRHSGGKRPLSSISFRNTVTCYFLDRQIRCLEATPYIGNFTSIQVNQKFFNNNINESNRFISIQVRILMQVSIMYKLLSHAIYQLVFLLNIVVITCYYVFLYI